MYASLCNTVEEAGEWMIRIYSYMFHVHYGMTYRLLEKVQANLESLKYRTQNSFKAKY